jgi:TolB protein
MNRPLCYALLVLALALGMGEAARAQLTIEIIGGGGTAVPIAIVPFAGEANYPYPLTELVGADLARSGLFRHVNPAGVNPRPARAEDVRFGDWTARGAHQAQGKGQHKKRVTQVSPHQ